MNKYLAMLKSAKNPEGEPAKPAKPLFDSFAGFAGSSPGRFQKINDASNEAERAPELDGLPVADGVYTPWSAPATPEQLHQRRQDLDAAICELAALERWSDEALGRVRDQVARQPVSTLLPDLQSFREQISAARALQRAWESDNVWRMEGFEARFYCAGCDGSCVGTRKRCSEHRAAVAMKKPK